MKRLISIGGGEPEYKTPEHIIDAMKEAMDEGHTHYGNFRHIPELREAVAAKYRRLGVDADPERVLITPGSTMGIYMVFNGLMEPGDDLLTFDPCFFGYFHSQRLLGFNPVPVPRYKEENWRFHVEDLYEAATPRTKALLICSPDNPTGAVLGDDELKGIAEFAEEKDITVISDDIYDEITYDGARFRSIASLPGMRERTVILNGLSKAYAMTGWRVGYAIAPDEELYEKFFEIQMSTFLVVNAAVQRAGVAALTGPQDCVREMVAEYAAVSPGLPTNPAVDEILMIDPPPARRMAGMANLTPMKTPLTFTAMMRSKSSSVVSSMLERIRIPALLTSTSSLP